MNKKFDICLLGYTSETGNTCWYPWNRFHDVFNTLGYKVNWTNLSNYVKNSNPTIFVLWNQPDAIGLIESGFYTKGKDIIIQKVVGGSPRFNTPPYGSSVEEAKKFFLNHNFPDYKMCLDLINDGHRVFVFGAKTSNIGTPIKKKICNELQDRMFMIPWGSCLYSMQEIQNMKPIMKDFSYDLGFVGSFWGNAKIGSLNNVNKYLKPLFDYVNPKMIKLAGDGTGKRRVSNEDHKLILQRSKICPIINSDSWRAMRGIQDRFWSVFSSGRFGICDSEGVYEFFDENEVVVETDPHEYVVKSIYYMRNVNKQEKYIINVLNKIKNEYNYYYTWDNILSIVEAS